jgi:urocanate hydratase
MNGGFGMLLDGSDASDSRLEKMLFFDVNNGIARRSWARNEGALFAIKREMERSPDLRVTLAALADEQLIKDHLNKA